MPGGPPCELLGIHLGTQGFQLHLAALVEPLDGLAHNLLGSLGVDAADAQHLHPFELGGEHARVAALYDAMRDARVEHVFLLFAQAFRTVAEVEHRHLRGRDDLHHGVLFKLILRPAGKIETMLNGG